MYVVRCVKIVNKRIMKNEGIGEDDLERVVYIGKRKQALGALTQHLYIVYSSSRDLLHCCCCGHGLIFCCDVDRVDVSSDNNNNTSFAAFMVDGGVTCFRVFFFFPTPARR